MLESFHVGSLAPRLRSQGVGVWIKGSELTVSKVWAATATNLKNSQDLNCQTPQQLNVEFSITPALGYTF